MSPEFYSLEMLVMSYERSYEGPAGSLAELFRQRRRDHEQLVAVLYAIEDENNT